MRSNTHSFRNVVRMSALTIAAFTALTFGGFEKAKAQGANAGIGYQTPMPLTQSALRDFFLSRGSESSTRSGATDALKAFYEKRDFQPVWTGSAEATQAATQMRNVLMQADQQGLDGAAYPASSLQAAPSLASGRDAAYYDVTVTEALLRYARDVRVGRTRPNDIYKDVGLPASDFDASAALELALRNRSVNEFLTDLPPAHPEYRWLGEALVRYRGIAKQGGWPSLTTGSESDSNVKLLVKRLAMEDSMLANIPNPSANELHEAITRYQTRNGIKPDGKVGSETLAALNVPVLVRIQQIVANMERWRWVPRQFEHRFIAVNIPDQSLTFVQDGRVLMSSRVIVGRKTSPTPILRTVAGALVANPPWNVPGDIAANQILPNLKRNPNYLAAHNMVVMNGPADDPRGLTIQWNNIPPGQFPYEIRQLPNPVSAMGVVMLDSPNDFDVYLHDTPGKKPFDDNERGISNGCIRVQQIMPLASLALTNDLSAGLGQLNQAIASHETRRLTLDDPLPVYMLYWTAIADANGNVGFRSDRYNRDPPLIAALAKTATATRS